MRTYCLICLHILGRVLLIILLFIGICLFLAVATLRAVSSLFERQSDSRWGANSMAGNRPQSPKVDLDQGISSACVRWFTARP
jgi:hypothetical protein